MVNTLASQMKMKAFKVLAVQFSVLSLVSVLLMLMWELESGFAFFIGVLLDILPAFVFAAFTFKTTGARQANSVVEHMMRGEKIKIVMTAVLFVLVLKFFPAGVPFVMLGFFISKLSQFLRPIFFL